MATWCTSWPGASSTTAGCSGASKRPRAISIKIFDVDPHAAILQLIAARRSRRPARDWPGLAQLFRRLAACAGAEADATEDRIWQAWMDHPHRGAAAVLEQATGDIAARRYDI